MISAKVLAHSVNTSGQEIMTFVLKYPRFIHSEFMTHRMLSRNAASSRAIPIQKMIRSVLDDTAFPEYWGSHQKGMQAGAELSGWRLWAAKKIWAMSCRTQACYVKALDWLGLHKQTSNRLIEPFAHITVLATATDWANFFSLRAHPDAQPEFQALAFAMLEAYVASKPVLKQPGQWHLPFAANEEIHGNDFDFDALSECLRICTARAARLSYLTHDGLIDPKKDCELHDRLKESGHWSPFDHAAMADPDKRHGNYHGWKAYRKFFPNENVTAFDPHELLARRKSA